MCLCEWIDNELLYADIKWCLFTQNTPPQLLCAVTYLAQQQHAGVPSATEAALKTPCSRGSHHSSAQQNSDSKAEARHLPLPFPAPHWCSKLFPSVTGSSGQHQRSQQDVLRACRMLPCTALGKRPCFSPHTMVADPHKEGWEGGQLQPFLLWAMPMPVCISQLTLLLPKRCSTWSKGSEEREGWSFATSEPTPPCSYAARAALGLRGTSGVKVQPLQIMMKLSLFIGWKNMTCLNFPCSLHLIRRNWVHSTVF